MCELKKPSQIGNFSYGTLPDVLKALLAGADIMHLCSVLLQHGTGRLAEILTEMEQWLAEHEHASTSQLKGSVSQQHPIDPSAYERANYVQVLDSYSSRAGALKLVFPVSHSHAARGNEEKQELGNQRKLRK
ncbi:MAG: hypothetical protein M0R47_11960 [Methylobacter sp.]|uniref:hypothetical protein n=1 Tax=Methylobacter sp. TaxID=2051955 RepID=UPI0025F90714|nr:hypothetical protein [Methylobacter sp.]MCK9621238.1 hypothetical protein [Methylobacter sp.]